MSKNRHDEHIAVLRRLRDQAVANAFGDVANVAAALEYVLSLDLLGLEAGREIERLRGRLEVLQDSFAHLKSKRTKIDSHTTK